MTRPNYQLLENQNVRCRDGVHLSTDIYLPTIYRVGIDKPRATILERTPYNKSEPSRSEIHGSQLWTRGEVASFFVDRGYAFVYQDCRGCYGSEGVFTKYLNEAKDGYDCIEWITLQAWSNGEVGMFGLSYAAHTQLAAACLNPPGLKCMCLDSGGFYSSYEEGIRKGGAFDLKQLTWAIKQSSIKSLKQKRSGADFTNSDEILRRWFKYTPWKAKHSPLRESPEYEIYVLNQWRNENFSDFWEQLGIFAKGYFEEMKEIPTLLMSSWYDAYVFNTIKNFQNFQKKCPNDVHLIMGPWLHGNRNTPYSGDAYFGESSKFESLGFSWLEVRYQWLSKYLTREPKFVEDSSLSLFRSGRATIFLMGSGSGKKVNGLDGTIDHGGKWISSSTYPANTTVLKLYFNEDGSLEANFPKIPSAVDFFSDPKFPFPTIGGSTTSGDPVFVGGAFNQVLSPTFFGTDGSGLPTAARNDVVVFETAILEEDLVVMGPLKVRVYISVDTPDTDICAKLIDVYPPSEDYPNGYDMNIQDGIFRCRYYKSFRKPELLIPNVAYKIDVDLSSTANVFVKGHKLRVDITGANFPHFDVNPNTGRSPATSNCSRTANITVHMSEEYQSHIALHVIENESLFTSL